MRKDTLITHVGRPETGPVNPPVMRASTILFEDVAGYDATRGDRFGALRYGIHGTEILFTIMGSGCAEVSRTQTDGTEFVVGKWGDGRIGTFRGLRDGAHGYGATVYGDKDIAQSGGYDGYQPLVVEIVKFFKTGQPPVTPEETLEIYAFMEAADESKREGGKPVTIDSVLAKARKAAAEMKLSP